MRYRSILAALIFVTALSTLSACKQTESSSDASYVGVSDVKNTISFRITWTDYSGRGQAIQKIVDVYNAENSEGDFIQLVGGDEDQDAIETVIADQPETILVLPYRHVQYFGDLGMLADMTQSFSAERALFYPAIWNLGAVDGISYGIPWLGHSMCLIYNQDLLSAAGIRPDSIQDVNSLIYALNRIEVQTGAKGIGLVGADSNDVSWMVNQFIYGFGGKLVSEDGKRVALNTTESAAALNFYKNVLGKHAQESWVNDTGLEVMEYFRNQQVAFEIQGIWGLTDIDKNGSPFEVGVIPLKNIGANAEVGPMMLAIPERMSESGKQQAIRFMQYLISYDAQTAILNGEYSPEHDTYYPFRTPIRVDMEQAQIIQLNPAYEVFIEGFENPSVDVPVPKWQTIKTMYYQPGLHEVMAGTLSIQDFLDQMETQGNRVLSEP